MKEMLKKWLWSAVVFIAIASFVAGKLMQAAAHKQGAFDWAYVFSLENIKKSLWIGVIALILCLGYYGIKYLLRREKRKIVRKPGTD